MKFFLPLLFLVSTFAFEENDEPSQKKRCISSTEIVLAAEEEPVGGLSLFPDEILLHILSFLDAKSLVRSQKVCRKLWNVIGGETDLQPIILALKNSRKVFIDIDTTGLTAEVGGSIKDRILHFSGIKVMEGMLPKRLNLYINPQKKSSAGAFAVHRLPSSFLEKSPPFSEVADQILAFIGNAPLVAHNANFDMRFLNAELKHAARPQINPSHFIDTVKIARRVCPGVQSYSLASLCAHYKIEVDSGIQNELEREIAAIEILYKKLRATALSTGVDISDLDITYPKRTAS